MTIQEEYGEALRIARTDKKMTLAAAAAYIGVSINTLRGHESGLKRIDDAKLIRAAAHFCVTPRALGVGDALIAELERLRDLARAQGWAVCPSRLTIWPENHSLPLDNTQ